MEKTTNQKAKSGLLPVNAGDTDKTTAGHAFIPGVPKAMEGADAGSYGASRQAVRLSAYFDRTRSRRVEDDFGFWVLAITAGKTLAGLVPSVSDS